MAAEKSDKIRRRKSRIRTRPIPPKEDMRKNPPLTILQTRFISALASSASATEAAGKAGYSSKNLDKSAHQVMKALRGRVPQILDDLGLDEKFVIENHLAPKLTAKRVHYFQKDGKVTDIQLSEDLPTQMDAINKIFQLHGSYAPRDPKEAEQFGVKVVVVDMPRPPGHPQNAVIDISGKGHEPPEEE